MFDINKILGTKGIKPGDTLPGMGINQTNMQAAQMLENNGFKIKGVVFRSVVGTVEIPIRISGTAKMLIGFKFVSDQASLLIPNVPGRIFALKVNNSVLIEDAPADAFTVNNVNDISKPYYEFIRMLNGSDNITLTLTDTGVNNYNMYLYYI